VCLATRDCCECDLQNDSVARKHLLHHISVCADRNANSIGLGLGLSRVGGTTHRAVPKLPPRVKSSGAARLRVCARIRIPQFRGINETEVCRRAMFVVFAESTSYYCCMYQAAAAVGGVTETAIDAPVRAEFQ